MGDWFAQCGEACFAALDSLQLLPPRNTDQNGVRVLMYHGILPRPRSRFGVQAVDLDMFRKQMQYLKRNFQLLHASQLTEALAKPVLGMRPQVVLTFDDGFANNATVARPVLEELQIPAIFFVSLRHTTPGRFLWFSHARALFACYPEQRLFLLGQEWSLATSDERNRNWARFCHLSRLVRTGELYDSLESYPVSSFIPSEIVEDEMRGMTEQEIAAVATSRMITIGAHTINHPYLTGCSEAEMNKEISASKTELERICGRPIALFAYPDGDYNAYIVAAVRKAGFQFAFAVNRRPMDGNEVCRFEIRRVGIYRGGTGLLAAKARGWLD